MIKTMMRMKVKKNKERKWKSLWVCSSRLKKKQDKRARSFTLKLRIYKHS